MSFLSLSKQKPHSLIDVPELQSLETKRMEKNVLDRANRSSITLCIHPDAKNTGNDP
jgi:hypothetical protein